MAFNYKKLLELHKLSGERSIDFSRAIFGDNSSLGPTYFKGKTEINTRHLEKMVTRLEKEISDKDEMINWLRRQCDVLSGLLNHPRKDSPESETGMGQNK